jgi:hypothetical protein
VSVRVVDITDSATRTTRHRIVISSFLKPLALQVTRLPAVAAAAAAASSVAPSASAEAALAPNSALSALALVAATHSA